LIFIQKSVQAVHKRTACLWVKKTTLMASQKVRSTVLQQFFETSTYNMYAFILEKPLRLVVRIFA